MKTKLIVIATIAFLLASVCIGCNKQENKNTPVVKNTVKGKEDIGKGRTVRVLNAMLKPGTGAVAYAERGNEGAKMIERINDIQSEYNVKIEYVGDGTWFPSLNKFHTSILVGDPNADLAYVGYEHVIQSFEKGGIYEVLNDYDDILELDNPDLWDQTVVHKLCTVNGYTAGIQATLRGWEAVAAGQVMYFNKTMLESEGIWADYNLYDIQNEKNWTWDKLDEIASKVVKDKDGDGQLDQYGMIYSRYTYTALNAANSSGGVYAGFFAVNDNNEPIFMGRDTPKMEVFDFFTKYGATGNRWLKYIDYGQQYTEGPRKFFADGNAAFLIDSGETIRELKSMKMQDTVGVVAVPIGPSNETKEYYLGKEGCLPWIIPSGLKDAKLSAYMMRELCSPLYNKEESELGTEAILSDYIGDEVEIIDTFKMLGEPERVSNSMESPFIATWWGSFASYHGNISNMIEAGFTGERLNQTWGDAVQEDLNKYWKQVMDGWTKLDEQRKEDGKV